MSDFTAVNAAAMQEGISDLNQAHRSLTEQLETLESQLEGSLATWDGAARSAYAAAKDAWDKAAHHMQDVIQKSGTVLSQITENDDVWGISNSRIEG